MKKITLVGVKGIDPDGVEELQKKIMRTPDGGLIICNGDVTSAVVNVKG